MGISLFEDMGDYGVLKELNHFQPNLNPEPETQLERIKEKAEVYVVALHEKYSMFNITRIIVEEPLANSMSQKVAKMLEIFNEYFCHLLAKRFGIKIDFISVDNARRFGLPELLGKDGKLMSDFPKSVAGLKKNDWGKFLIMYLVSQRYPQIKWILNNALKISKANFDRADSVVAGLGFMIKSGLWTKMGTQEFWDGSNFSYENCVTIIEKNVAYEKFTKNHIDKDKTLSAKDKLKVKKKYLLEVFNIDNYLNVEFKNE
jgi:hypothetical protein